MTLGPLLGTYCRQEKIQTSEDCQPIHNTWSDLVIHMPYGIMAWRVWRWISHHNPANRVQSQRLLCFCRGPIVVILYDGCWFPKYCVGLSRHQKTSKHHPIGSEISSRNHVTNGFKPPAGKRVDPISWLSTKETNVQLARDDLTVVMTMATGIRKKIVKSYVDLSYDMAVSET